MLTLLRRAWRALGRFEGRLLRLDLLRRATWPFRNVPPFPRTLRREEEAVLRVLRGSDWNMAYGRGLVHERLEAEFAASLGVAEAVAVNTGGMAIQMALRALGIVPGDEVVHQVDTCVANAFAVMNAGATPIFADVDPDTFLLSRRALTGALSPRTRVLMPVHMWGHPEDMDMVLEESRARDLVVLEDCCLALGAQWNGRPVGTFGTAAVFSFGCLKPIQAGEGGMIATNDSALAKELRAMRNWGDRSVEFGVRDHHELSWNGRLSEIVAAVALEQLRGYPTHLKVLRESVEILIQHLSTFSGLQLLHAGNARRASSWTQVVLKIDEAALGRSKHELMEGLKSRGVHVWHANFEPIPSVSFFRNDRWKTWLPESSWDRAAASYGAPYPNAEQAFAHTGMGLGMHHLLSTHAVRHLVAQIAATLASRP